MKNKSMLLNVVFWVFRISLILAISFSLYYYYNSYFLTSFYRLSLSSEERETYFELYSKYAKVQNELSETLSSMRIIIIPVFIITCYFTLKYLGVIKKERVYKSPYYIAAISFFCLILNNSYNSNERISSLMSIFLYISNNIFGMVSTLLILPLTVVTIKYTVLYFLNKYDKNIQKITKELRKKRLEQKIKDAEEKLNELES